jgi:hypothetical protein
MPLREVFAHFGGNTIDLREPVVDLGWRETDGRFDV